MDLTFLERFLWSYIFLALIMIMGIALYGIIFRPHIIKKIIALTIFGDVVNVFAIYIGFRGGVIPVPPVYPTWNVTAGTIREMLSRSVDPLPQALVITAIVINMAVTLFIVFIAIQTYRLYGTLDARKIKELRG
ncbi:MAG TPA: Na+/H+ antiporter subunit C [Acidilobales archaeon]|nr:MAG: Na+/H+ antiporter subunit C [Desulfurococcales archaeon ex4484_42]HDD25692.1 Na+/H+ antiporter subunit C [Acidilobales archaeon]